MLMSGGTALRQRQTKMHDFAEFRHGVFAFRAGLSVTLEIRQFLVAEVAAWRKRS